MSLKTHWSATWILLLLLTHAGGASAEQATSPVPAGDPATLATVKQRAWWNHNEVVTELTLTAEQRGKMDELLLAAVQQQLASQRLQQEASEQFEEALRNGDLQAARQAAPRVREALGDSWDCKSMLMVDVLSVLDGAQRQKVLTSHPDLLRQPWEERSAPWLRDLGFPRLAPAR